MFFRNLCLFVVAVSLIALPATAGDCYNCPSQGDFDLDGMPVSVADVTLYAMFFAWGLGILPMPPEGHIANSDVNCDGVVLTVGDHVQGMRILTGDADLCCADSIQMPPDMPGWPAGSSNYRVEVGKFVREQDYPRGYIPVTVEQAADRRLLSFIFTLSFETTGITVDSVTGGNLSQWDFINGGTTVINDTAYVHVIGQYDWLADGDSENPTVSVGDNLSRIWVTLTEAVSDQPHTVRFYFGECNDNGITLGGADGLMEIEALLVSNDVWEDGTVITDPLSVYGGLDSCCIDTSYDNPPRRAIDFVNRTMDFPEICCVGMRGDINGDGIDADPVDLGLFVDALFACGGMCFPCEEEANMDGEGIWDPIDLAYLIDYLYTGGPPPADCNP